MSGARHENTMTPPPSGLANAAASQCQEMMARTRLYQGGRLELEVFQAADISEYLATVKNPSGMGDPIGAARCGSSTVGPAHALRAGRR
jgi:hypothetical protein